MASHDRGRSPSAGLANNHHIRPSSASASPHPHPTAPTSLSHPDPTALNSNQYTALPASNPYHDPAFTHDASRQPDFLFASTYQDFPDPPQSLQPQAPAAPSQTSNIADHTFLQSAGGFSGQGSAGAYNYNSSTQSRNGSDNVSPHALSHTTSPDANSASDTSAFPSFDFSQVDFDDQASVDPSLLVEPNSVDLLQPQPGPDNLGGSLDPMATMQTQHAPTPPHFIPDMARAQSHTPSPHASPGFQQTSFGPPSRARGVSESLDPSSALYPQGQADWGSMNTYRQHRRTPSDNYSDYSSHSNQASPYMPSLESFEANAHSSPLLNASNDPTFNDGLGRQLGHFTLNENQAPVQQQYYSPGHSPQVMAQQNSLPAFTTDNHYGLNMDLNGQFPQQDNGLDMYSGAAPEPFPSMNQPSPGGDPGNADQMSPPEINIDYAPPSRNPMENVSRPTNDGEALSPLMKSNASRKRIRAKSDSHAGAKPAQHGLPARGRSPSLQPQVTGDNKLSPFDAQTSAPSRSSTPSRGRNGSGSGSLSGNRHRSSSNTSDREYYLDLANPDRAPSTGADKGRVQKHPATFQCSLCPKRFTRAYNLRSHLRTHTDERPFVCTVCGKAFARQHDRKRHEGLHSGEKKFVCRGTLASTAQWGCGRRFARADALGRHFRSEAGRVCIKPLLDEEAAERQRTWHEEQAQAQVAAGLVAPQPVLGQPQIDMMGNFLPAALLQQYPALGRIDWNAMPQGPPPDELDDFSGRSPFDASSGGEYLDDVSEGELSSYSMQGNGNGSGGGGGGGNQAIGGGLPVGTTQFRGGGGADYLSDFEGR